jgi:membrane fusion protein (multidrug efflux system)
MQDKPQREPHEQPGDASDDTPAQRESGEKQARPLGVGARLRAHPYIAAATGVLIVAAAIGIGLWWLHARHYESTDDAFIDARQFAISPKVAGYISKVAVTDNEQVEEGQLLIQIDDRDYQIALQQAEAQLEQAQAAVRNASAQIEAQEAQATALQDQLHQAEAALTFATQENTRAETLLKGGNATLQHAQQLQSQLQQAQATANAARSNTNAALKQVSGLKAQKASALANVDAAGTQVAQARLNLDHTRLTAAQKGRVVHLTAAKGQYVQPGQNLSMFVPYPIWVTANFKETQIAAIRPGQAVSIEIDAFAKRNLHGRVVSIQSGSGTAFSLLPAENATGNYVKVVQRVPVKIAIDDIPADLPLGPGMSVVPTVTVR